jgi:hypothetical protein
MRFAAITAPMEPRPTNPIFMVTIQSNQSEGREAA